MTEAACAHPITSGRGRFRRTYPCGRPVQMYRTQGGAVIAHCGLGHQTIDQEMPEPEGVKVTPSGVRAGIEDQLPRPAVEFDAVAAAARRDVKIARADDAANSEWKDRADAAVLKACQTVGQFTTDRIWVLLGEKPSEGRAMGSVMKRAREAGWCEDSGTFRKSTDVACNRRDKRVWTSLLFQGGPGARSTSD